MCGYGCGRGHSYVCKGEVIGSALWDAHPRVAALMLSAGMKVGRDGCAGDGGGAGLEVTTVLVAACARVWVTCSSVPECGSMCFCGRVR